MIQHYMTLHNTIQHDMMTQHKKTQNGKYIFIFLKKNLKKNFGNFFLKYFVKKIEIFLVFDFNEKIVMRFIFGKTHVFGVF